MIRFVEVLNKTDKNPRMERVATLRFELGEVWINEKYVVNVRPHVGYDSLLKEGKMGMRRRNGERRKREIGNGNTTMMKMKMGKKREMSKHQ